MLYTHTVQHSKVQGITVMVLTGQCAHMIRYPVIAGRTAILNRQRVMVLPRPSVAQTAPAFVAPLFRVPLRPPVSFSPRPRILTTMSAQRKITFVTGNANKLREVQQILTASGATQFELVSEKLDLPELQGTIDSVARAKCAEAARRVRGPVLVEDTALVRTQWCLRKRPLCRRHMYAIYARFVPRANTGHLSCLNLLSLDFASGVPVLQCIGRASRRLYQMVS